MVLKIIDCTIAIKINFNVDFNINVDIDISSTINGRTFFISKIKIKE